MKKFLFIFAAALLFMAGCSEESTAPEEENPKEEKQTEEVKKDEEPKEDAEPKKEEKEESKDIESEEIKEESPSFDVDEAKELLEYSALGDNDKLTDLNIEDGEIKAVVEVGDNDLIDDKKLLAETIYSSAGDEFLAQEGWEVLTIEFIDVGKVSMNRNEKETNEVGDYFPTKKIMEQLGN
ncbi:hypothetical protein J22TS1_43490 [Siminovitchia terrae]|uniref:hypothetical protein n=1 Tax=Siminovitchia terrae TaxID=1914933 RepID=UPI001AFD3642|nr:hypothetical protein [Siminovitchia terrae]GIN93298.1 hypothetical protein J22TS1_43490 [Siminovitchia terrae]